VETGLSDLRLKNAEFLGLDDGRYAGEKVSRKSLHDSSEELSDELSDDTESEESEPVQKVADDVGAESDDEHYGTTDQSDAEYGFLFLSGPSLLKNLARSYVRSCQELARSCSS
jgi:hypothetical protein